MSTTVLGIVKPSVRRRVRAHGQVQGVFFRDSVRGEAASRGVSGWVRNCSDGTVEAVFEGDPDAVDALVAFCRSGPGSSDVSSLDVVDEPVESLAGFEVR
jgi:acylphosphatase